MPLSQDRALQRARTQPRATALHSQDLSQPLHVIPEVIVGDVGREAVVGAGDVAAFFEDGADAFEFGVDGGGALGEGALLELNSNGLSLYQRGVAAASAGSVAPMTARSRVTASSPSRASGMQAPEVMKSTSEP